VGTDSFVYQVSDEHGSTQQATVVLTVLESSAPPVTAPDSFTVSKEGTVTGNVLANDSSDQGSILTASLVTPPTLGTVTLGAAGQFEYVAGDTAGVDSFSYVATDSLGKESVEEVTINVLAVNQAPVATPIGDQVVIEEQVSTVDLANFFTDPEGEVLVYDVSGQPGFASVTGSLLSVTPPPGVAAGESFTVIVGASDGENPAVTQQIVFQVAAPNQAPEVNPAQDQDVFVGTAISADVAGQFNDPDGDPLSYSLTTNAPFLTLSGGILSGTPSIDDKGEYTVTIEATDGEATVATTFTLTVPNQSPVVDPIQGQSVFVNNAINSNVASHFNDPDGDPLGYSLTTDAPFLTLSPAGILSGTPSINDKGGYTVTIEATDGAATVATTFTLTVPNQSPVVDPIQDQSVFVNNAINANVVSHFNDPDGDPLSYSLSTNAGFLTLSPGGTLFGTPSPGQEGVYSVTIVADDGTSTVSDTFSLTVSAVPNQAPVANADSYSTSADTTLIVYPGYDDLLINDTDADGDTLTVDTLPLIDVSHGTLALNADGTFTYTPDSGFTGSDSFQYRISDGQGGTSTAVASISVNPPPTTFAVNSGDFATGSTWSTGVVPGSADAIDISAGVTVNKITGTDTVSELSLSASGAQLNLATSGITSSNGVTVGSGATLGLNEATLTAGGSILNLGQINIYGFTGATATIVATTFDTGAGSIDVASGNTLYLDSTTTTLGTSS
ncbi:MAG: tandem-95 repeat protein, partial [Gammaproteobacteria bacterium]|nr:tandem-95 repeat protein [Gammaproteobacteria bacterium]